MMMIRTRLLLAAATCLALGACDRARPVVGPAPAGAGEDAAPAAGAVGTVRVSLPEAVGFNAHIRPILSDKCFSCHGYDATTREADLRLDTPEGAYAALAGAGGHYAIVPGDSAASEVWRRITAGDPEHLMPPPDFHKSLNEREIQLIAAWIDQGAEYEEHWSFTALTKPEIPVPARHADEIANPIDAFVLARLEREGLSPAPLADKATLLRRISLNLTGLTPAIEELAAFLSDESPDAYAKQVDRLLASPRHGERWARHWMDVAHFAETQGHDEDAIRPNAWPYRDYLIESFNADKPYARFVMEQVAGDVLFPGEPAATVATGFLAAGPWDGSSQMGIQDGTLDKKVAQYLDRDDMLTTVMLSFNSLTVHCARCHDHKFDPIPTSDYYALQAVFAGVDRADRDYDANPESGRKRGQLIAEMAVLDGPDALPEARLREVEKDPAYRQWLAESAGAAVWQVLDPEHVETSGGATVVELDDRSLLFGGARPEKDTYMIRVPATAMITALRLEVLADASLPRQGPGRQENGNFHLSEFRVTGPDGKPVPVARAEADWNQDGWRIDHAIDGVPDTAWGIFPKVGASHTAILHFVEPVTPPPGGSLTIALEQLHGGSHLIGRLRLSASSASDPSLNASLPEALQAVLTVPAEDRDERQRRAIASHYLRRTLQREIDSLPGSAPAKVFAVSSNFEAMGNFKPAGGPRPVHVLHRGNIEEPGELAQPGALSSVRGLQSRFDLPETAGEGERRAALAHWLAHHDNVLTWRSIVNRVWHYHFGRGLVATPNDFGTMGEAPTHPELLDWLACEFRERGGSLKWLHKEILTSATYRQASTPHELGDRIDKDNRWLWRMHRPRLDAESLRDTVLSISGKLDLTMGGPSARQFLESKGVHVTPNLDYLTFDPDDPANFRRSIYRFVFRTLPDPLMQALDCPDASQWTPERSASFNALGALAMANSPFLVRQSEHLAARLETEHPDIDRQVVRLFQLAYQRDPDADELPQVVAYARRHGLANACRVILNSNEFVFIE